MKKLRLYLDTTVWNFPFAEDAPEKQGHTLDFFQRVHLGAFEIFGSDAVVQELSATPDRQRRFGLLQLWSRVNPRMVEATPEVKQLAARYLQAKALPTRSSADALHAALASVHQVDALVS